MQICQILSGETPNNYWIIIQERLSLYEICLKDSRTSLNLFDCHSEICDTEVGIAFSERFSNLLSKFHSDHSESTASSSFEWSDSRSEFPIQIAILKLRESEWSVGRSGRKARD